MANGGVIPETRITQSISWEAFDLPEKAFDVSPPMYIGSIEKWRGRDKGLNECVNTYIASEQLEQLAILRLVGHRQSLISKPYIVYTERWAPLTSPSPQLTPDWNMHKGLLPPSLEAW